MKNEKILSIVDIEFLERILGEYKKTMTVIKIKKPFGSSRRFIIKANNKPIIIFKA